MAIGAKLSNLINSRNTNVNQLAAATGVSPSTIYSIIKRDNMKVDLDDLQKIADELCVTLDYFANADDIPPDPPRSVLADRIKHLIEQSGKSYLELEEITGVRKSSLQRYASGRTTKIPLDAIEKLAETFNVSQSYLMGWTDSPAAVADPPRSVLVNELLEIFESLPIEGQTRILGYAERLLDEQEKRPRGR